MNFWGGGLYHLDSKKDPGPSTGVGEKGFSEERGKRMHVQKTESGKGIKELMGGNSAGERRGGNVGITNLSFREVSNSVNVTKSQKKLRSFPRKASR